MKRVRFLSKAKSWFWLLLILSYAALAASTVIDTLNPKYRELGHVQLVSAQSPAGQRELGAAQAAAVYRATSGSPFTALPTGSTFRIIWPDGSSETVTVLNPASASGARVTTPAAGQSLDASVDVDN